MILHLIDGTTRDIPMGSALTGYACNVIEVSWVEFDKCFDRDGTERAMAYLNKEIRTRLVPGAELRIVQKHNHGT